MMTINERTCITCHWAGWDYVAEEFTCRNPNSAWTNEIGGVSYVGQKTGDVVSALQALPPAQQWIPCSERLPEVGRCVLLSVAGIYTAEGCLRNDSDWNQFRWDAIQRKDMVGAWMPLPEPFKGGEDE